MKLPSAADLDAYAAEDRIKQATQGSLYHVNNRLREIADHMKQNRIVLAYETLRQAQEFVEAEIKK